MTVWVCVFALYLRERPGNVEGEDRSRNSANEQFVAHYVRICTNIGIFTLNIYAGKMSNFTGGFIPELES